MADITVSITAAPVINVSVGDFGSLSVSVVRDRLEAPATVSVPNGSSAMLDSVGSASYKSTSWDIYLTHTDGRKYQCTIRANIDTAGTAVDYCEFGQDDQGDWTGTITCDLSSGNIRLLVAGTQTDWTAYAVRSFMKAGI